jgi:hypothetical protein
MSRLNQDDRATIFRAALALQPIAPVLAGQLRGMLDGPPVLTIGEVPDALADYFGATVLWTAGNLPSWTAAESVARTNARNLVFAKFIEGERSNDMLYRLLPQYSSYTINRRVSEMKERGLVIEVGEHDSGGRLFTIHTLAPTVRAYIDGDEQPDLFS